MSRKKEVGYDLTDLTVFFMGLNNLELIKDPYVTYYQLTGRASEEDSCKNEGMSIPGLINTLEIVSGKAQERGTIREDGIPPQGSVCYLAKRKLTEKGMERFNKLVERMNTDGILPEEAYLTIKSAYTLRDIRDDPSRVAYDSSAFLKSLDKF